MKILFAKAIVLQVLLFCLSSQNGNSGVQAYNIVHLGDSYSSGNGGGNYEDRVCWRSPNNWGNTLANLLNADSYNNRACSGGQTSDLAGQDDVIDASTDLVLVGVGGNDLNFPDVVLQCFIPSFRSRGGCFAEINQVHNLLSAYRSNLNQALLDVFDKIDGDAVVVLVAYPHITENTDYTANCCDFVSPNRDVISGLRDLGDDIEDVQRQAVQDANNAAGREFVYFYDGTKALFEGHEPHPDRFVENPDRWIYEWGVFFPPEETYHLNPRGHSELGKALFPFVSPILPARSTEPPTESPTAGPTATVTDMPTMAPTSGMPTLSPITGTPTLRPTTGPPVTAPTLNPTFSPPAFPNPSPTPDSSGFFCFSERATVQVEHRSVPVAMKDLKIGDRILTRSSKYNSILQYEPIYAFGHRHESQMTPFLKISTTNGAPPLELSAEHMAFVKGKAGPVRADSLRVGDELLIASATNELSAAAIQSISTVTREGLYAPLTPSGTLVVNGILASSYVGAQAHANEYLEIGSGDGKIVMPLLQADVIHLWLSPLRVVCQGISSKFCDMNTHNYNSQGMHVYVAAGFDLVKWGERQSPLVQMLTLLLVLSVMGSIHLIELAVGMAMGWYGVSLIFLLGAAALATMFFLLGGAALATIYLASCRSKRAKNV